MDHFRELEYFVSIAKHQRVGKASQELNISQPTLSKFVQKIEGTLGLTLFNKLGNKFLLTYAGKRYLETAEAILQMKRDLYRDLSAIEKDHVDEIKIGMSILRGQCIMPKVLPLFREKYPNVKVSIFEASSYFMEQKILNGNLDIAFVVMPAKNPELSCEILVQEEMVLLMPLDCDKAKFAQQKEGFKYPWIDIKELEEEQFILLWSDQRTRRVVDQVFREANVLPQNILTTRNIMTSIELVTNGYGMTFSGELPLHYFQLNEKLNVFSVGQNLTLFTLSVIHRSGVNLSPITQEFIAMVKDQIDQTMNSGLL